MYLFMAVLGLCYCVGFSLEAANGGYSLIAVRGLLFAVASLVACRFPYLWHVGSEVVTPAVYGACA